MISLHDSDDSEKGLDYFKDKTERETVTHIRAYKPVVIVCKYIYTSLKAFVIICC